MVCLADVVRNYAAIRIVFRGLQMSSHETAYHKVERTQTLSSITAMLNFSLLTQHGEGLSSDAASSACEEDFVELCHTWPCSDSIS